MKLLSLLTVAIVLIGITTQAFACYYERMSRSQNYAKITMPKKTLSVPQVHGICVAPNGKFAVMSYNNAKKIRIYYSCGKLMKEFHLGHGFVASHDCAFSDRRLYVADYNGRKVYELSPTGKFIRVLATGVTFFRMEACQNRLYVTTAHGGPNVHVYDTSIGRLIRRISVPGGSRGVIMGIDNTLHISNFGNQVYTYTPEGRRIGVKTYKEVQRADGIAMDTDGNLLIADHDKGEVKVYSPCGALIKTIRTGTRYSTDVEIANDGTVMVADPQASKVFMY